MAPRDESGRFTKGGGGSSLSILTNFPEFAEAFRRSPDRLARSMKKWLDLYGKEFMFGTLPRERMRGRPGLFTRSGGGGLRGSLRAVVAGEALGELALSMVAGGGGTKYARVHEYGATIVPKAGNPTGLLRWKGMRADGTFGWISAKKVKIPPRLGMRLTFKSTEQIARRGAIIRRAAAEALEPPPGLKAEHESGAF